MLGLPLSEDGQLTPVSRQLLPSFLLVSLSFFLFIHSWQTTSISWGRIQYTKGGHQHTYQGASFTRGVRTRPRGSKAWG